MPIYEFHCEECDKDFEALVMISSALKDVSCKHCNSTNIKKMVSATSQNPTTGGGIPAGALSGCSSSSGFS